MPRVRPVNPRACSSCRGPCGRTERRESNDLVGEIVGRVVGEPKQSQRARGLGFRQSARPCPSQAALALKRATVVLARLEGVTRVSLRRVPRVLEVTTHTLCLCRSFGYQRDDEDIPNTGGVPMDEELLSVPTSWPKAEVMFRTQIVAPLVDPLSSPEEKRQWRRFVTNREHTFPNGKVRRIAERTLRSWVAAYRQEGWRGLERRPCPKKGTLCKLSPEILARAVQLKQEEPRRTIPHILRIIETERNEALDISASALWRHLAKVGLGARGAAPPAGLHRWETQKPNQLWQSDVKHGPYLPDPLRHERMRKTYLIAFLDDYSRCIMHAEWFWAEDVYSLEIAFQKALLRKGKPCRVYVDRGMIYQSHVFRSACMELGIRHVSSKAYRPMGKGKIEKYWQNVDREFLLELEHSPVSDLDEMNRRFWAWLDEVYHQRVHSETGQTPLARFTADNLAPLPQPERLAELFLWRVKRTVDKTGCVSFEGNTYQIEPGLERRKVELRYHPLHLQRLQVWTGDRRWADAVPLDLQCPHVKAMNPRHMLPDQTPPALYLEALVRRHEAHKRQIVSPLQMSAIEGGDDRV